ncbi:MULTISPECIES: hypothetical protein [unclassified Methanoregula]|uniref:hypothetical protein n=1 Tax=unclassified Methanoregula TaxID=2649730 RepID=UPI0009C89065|nr:MULTISPECIES: hypothetical protein [unclassified Methanoregula]OPX62534.1 MAG: hypothetical protein A4E33_02283 [Methanoregula sp. PtaB.Bin085]OPY31633.1 MAG: hypothetical protein A4E34_02826 [Methanoregula sp. PtaU1.Bin006]
MNNPAQRSRLIFIWSWIFALCILALLFVFFYVSMRCGHLMLAGNGTTNCVVGIGTFWIEGAFVAAALFSLYRVNRLMAGG